MDMQFHAFLEFRLGKYSITTWGINRYFRFKKVSTFNPSSFLVVLPLSLLE